MINFKNYFTHLTESTVRSGDFPRVAGLVSSYMTKHVGKTYYFPQPEIFISGGKTGQGVRFFVDGRSFRLNWIRQINQSMGLDSIDYWDGSKPNQTKPTSHIALDRQQSLVVILPFVRDFLLGKVQKQGVFVNEDYQQDVDVLSEAVYTHDQLLKTVNNMLHAFQMGVQIRQQTLMGGNKKFGPKWNDAQRIVRDMYPELFNAKPGNKQLVIDKEDVKKIDPHKIATAMAQGSGSVEFAISSGKPEVIEVEGATSADIDRMTYEEQLDSLKTGMKLLMANATNALFVGGRGGTGKTQTVEDMLAAAGKEDGEGYFKITGSATPVGIYRILHTHRKDIVLFDDSDSALNDQEGRNLFKAASDTKKVRKISWMKGGKNFVDPSEYDEESDDETLPRYFEFTGKIIFISNLALNKLDPDGALRTRGYVINVDPTNEEIYDFMLKIVERIPLDVNYSLSKDQRMEVVEVLRSRKVADKTANLRSLVRGLNTRAGVEQQGGSTEEWKKFVKMFA